jgi:aspartyl-tRNA synthetase
MAGAIKLKLASWDLPPLESGPGPVVEKPKQQQQQQQQGERDAPKLAHPDDGPYGDLAVNQSRYKMNRVWSEVSQLNASKANTEVWLRGRVHSKVAKGSMVFIVLRERFATLQLLIHAQITTKEMVKFAGKIPPESIIDIFGEVKETKVEKTTQKDVEVQVKRIYVVSASEPVLPFQLEDASAPESETIGEEEQKAQKEGKKGGKGGDNKGEKKHLSVGQETRLNHRWIDLRTPANHAIFRLQGAVQKYFREYFDALGFVEIHSPKITPG